MPTPLATDLAAAEQALAAGMLGYADMLVWKHLHHRPTDADGWLLAGRVALAANARPQAIAAFRRSLACHPDHAAAGEALRRAEQPVAGSQPATPGYLLIREWQAGFWSDVDHVLGQLLLAEITGRTPIVHWGAESRFRSQAPGQDAWRRYFEPVSAATIGDLAGSGSSYFPPKWTAANLTGLITDKWAGEWARIAAVECLGRTERVVVSDFHSSPHLVARWLPAQHPMYDHWIHAVYRYLADKYLRPRAELSAAAAELRRNLIGPGPAVAVHVRLTDKALESGSLAGLYAGFPGEIEAQLDKLPGARVFLLTDSLAAVAEYRRRYGERLACTPSFRTDGIMGPHFTGAHAPHELGREVLVDSVIAASCDAFIGTGWSNVACMISRLKDWPAGSCILKGDNVQEYFHTLLYKP